MTEEADALFGAFFSLEELRELLRESAPHHRLSEDQKKRLKERVDEIKKHLFVLEKLG
jgi:DNA-binding transcriptional MerR regulator